MKKTFILCSLVLFLIGCATFYDYEPKTAVEEEVKGTLVAYFNRSFRDEWP